MSKKEWLILLVELLLITLIISLLVAGFNIIKKY